MTPTVNVVYWPGTNCERETLHAFRSVGAEARLVFFHDLKTGAARLDDADLLCIPGGFSYGDHVGGGALAALSMRAWLADQLAACRARPILCICNGFQIGIRTGLFGEGVTLTYNASGTFHHDADQPHLVDAENDSPWLEGLGGMELRFPCAHGEGRFLFTDRQGWRPALRYPADRNPDGSMEHIAGITSADGLALGMMNHPERALRDPKNLAIFENGVDFVRG